MLRRTKLLGALGGLMLACVACSREPQPVTDPTVAPERAPLAPLAPPPAAQPANQAARVAAGAYLWDAPPFEELTFAAAVAHCAERDATLLGNNQWLAEHVRHRDVLWVEGVFWSSSASTLDMTEAYVVELGPTSSGSNTRSQSERHSVRCASRNPTPPTAPADTLPGSCDTIETNSQCMQHDAEAFATLPAESRAVGCTDFAGGSYRREACPADGLVGRCPGRGGQHRHYYRRGGTPWDEVRARESCGEAFELAEPL